MPCAALFGSPAPARVMGCVDAGSICKRAATRNSLPAFAGPSDPVRARIDHTENMNLPGRIIHPKGDHALPRRGDRSQARQNLVSETSDMWSLRETAHSALDVFEFRQRDFGARIVRDQPHDRIEIVGDQRVPENAVAHRDGF